MKRIVDNQHGVTLIETVAATAIIVIIMVTILGALLYGQKMVVFSDVKNNAAADGQKLIDDVMSTLTDGVLPDANALNATDVTNMTGEKFFYDSLTPKQYWFEPVDVLGKPTALNNAVGYQIYIRVYYNNGESYVELRAFAKKGGIWV